ncbi:hypothetical protein [Microbacterium esteraromaticum]|nr:hypothetical protein [Microbacterium esteraromaticum]
MSLHGSRSRRALKSARWAATITAVVALIFGTAVPASAASAPVAASSVGVSSTVTAGVAGGPVKTSLAGFNPGNIISDAVFTAKSSMTEAQIQAFLNSKVRTCRSGYTCLKDLRISTRTRSGDAYCNGYAGASSESAARIIYKVAQSCGINPQVLIVMLQKEQGLVSHTYPSPGRYGIAMGFNCPDTAPCDPGSAGFFTQMYGAARQMQLYMEGRYFTWYAPGKTWNILYNPNTSCGRAPVYVANKATSAMYYYTPYQPNAAALAAGYGEAKPCGAYGNRNFYNYFTDWFGSTQAAASPNQGLVKVGPAVWLLSGENRYHVTAVAYAEYKRVFDSPVNVDANVLTRYQEGSFADLYVKNASSGTVAMLQDGQTHRFASCGLVSDWGGACGAALVVLTDDDFGRFAVGAEMTSFGRLTTGGRIHELAGSKITPLYDNAVAKQRNGGEIPYAAVLPAAAKTAKAIDKQVRFLPGIFVKASDAPEVWLPDEDGVLHHLVSWPLAAELGLPRQVGTVVPAVDLTGYKETTSLSVFVRCAGKDYVAAGGKLSPLSDDVPLGFTTTALTDVTCSYLDLTGPALRGTGVFVRFGASSEVYLLAGGQYRPIPTDAQQRELNGGIAPTILTAGSAFKSRVSIGSRYPATGTFVRVNGTPEVWLVDSDTLIHLPNWATAVEYGLPSRADVVASSAIAGMEKRASLTPFAKCGNSTFVAAGGRLRAVPEARVAGGSVTALSSKVCAGRIGGTAVDAPVFLSDGLRTSVAVGGGFSALPDATAVSRAAAGTPVILHRVSAAYLSALPASDVPGEGALVRSSAESAVTLIDGEFRMHLPNWGVAADLGVLGRYQVVAPEAIASRAVGGPAVGIFVTCGSQTYTASRGELYPVTKAAIGGFVPLPLSIATCKTLQVRAGSPDTGLLLTSSDGIVYALTGGKLVPAARPNPAILWLTVDTRTIDGMPTG